MDAEDTEGRPVRAHTDWFLQDLVDMVNATQGTFEIPITLNLGGGLVSGILTSGDKYFEGVSSIMTPWFTDGDAQASIGDMFTKHAALYKDEREGRLEPPTYVHLRDALFFSPRGGSTPNNGGVWWRGRIQQVDGFCIGQLTPARTE